MDAEELIEDLIRFRTMQKQGIALAATNLKARRIIAWATEIEMTKDDFLDLALLAFEKWK